jgi:predicted SAM-dependent methyltransferase
MKIGRPKLPPDERLSMQHGIRFTSSEYKSLKRDAGKLKVSVPELIRQRVKYKLDDRIGWESCRVPERTKKLHGTFAFVTPK